MVKAQSVRCCYSSCTSRVVGVGVGAAAAVGVGVDGEPTGMSVICMSVQIRQRSCVIQAGAVSLVGVTVTTYRQIGCRRWPSCAVFAVAPWRPLPDGYVGLALGQVLFGSTKQKTRSRRTRISVVVGAPQCSSSEDGRDNRVLCRELSLRSVVRAGRRRVRVRARARSRVRDH